MKLGIYKHYKGGMYKVLYTARHSETLEELVVYQALYDSKDFGKNAIWVRPKEMFFDKVEVNGQIASRFRYVRGD